MRKPKYSEFEILNILREASGGVATSRICKKYGISDTTFYNWRARYAPADRSQARAISSLQSENALLKCLIACLAANAG